MPPQADRFKLAVVTRVRARAGSVGDREAQLLEQRSAVGNAAGQLLRIAGAEHQCSLRHHLHRLDERVEALAYLKRQVKLGALSNIDDRSLSFSIEKMRVEFDIVVTAERAGAYKPSYPHFVLALNDLGAMGVAPAKLLHVGQSLRADIRPANSLGIASAWIQRAERTLGATGHGAEFAVPDATFPTLAELVEAHKLELG